MLSTYLGGGAVPLLCGRLGLLRNELLSIHWSRGGLHVQRRGKGSRARRDGGVRVLADIGVSRLGGVAVARGSLRVGEELGVPPGVLARNGKVFSGRGGEARNGAVRHRDGAVALHDIRLNTEGLHVVGRIRL